MQIQSIDTIHKTKWEYSNSKQYNETKWKSLKAILKNTRIYYLTKLTFKIWEEKLSHPTKSGETNGEPFRKVVWSIFYILHQNPGGLKSSM